MIDLRFRSKPYLKWVETLPCCNCRKSYDITAHHLKGRGHKSGSSVKAPDGYTMPLCEDCHTKLHAGGSGMLDDQAMWIAETAALFIEKALTGLGPVASKMLMKGISDY